MFNIFLRSDVIIERSKSSGSKATLQKSCLSSSAPLSPTYSTHSILISIHHTCFEMAFYNDICPKWLLFMPLFLSSSSFLHFPPGILLEKDFLATKLFSSTSTSLLEPSTPLPLPPLHYFTLFSRISPTHLSLSVGHISPEEKPVLYILHLL